MSDFKHVPSEDWGKVRDLDVAALVEGAREGLDMHVGELRRRFGDQVYHTVSYMAPAAASEVVQDVFVDLPRLLTKYEERGNFGAWIRRIARNRARTKARSLWNRADVEQSMTPQRADDAAVRSPSESIVNDDFRERLIELLADRERDVWLLSVQGYSHPEIAAQLNLSVPNSQKILSRARKKLGLRFDEWLADDDTE